MAESLVNIRVPKEMKDRMRRTGINWSEELRSAISAKLDSEQRRDADEKLEHILSSVKPGFSTQRAIMEDRRRG